MVRVGNDAGGTGEPDGARRTQRLVAAAKSAAPEGLFLVGIGLVISGISTYGFQILAFRGLSKPDYGALNALWVFVFVLAPGVFLPLEQEVGRAVAARRARGVGGGPVVRNAGVLGAAFAFVFTVVIIIVSVTTHIVTTVFNNHWGLVACLIVSLYTFGIEYLSRGAFAGMGRFDAYGISLGAEGVLRFLPAIPLAAYAASNPVWFGLCLALPPLAATAIALRGQHDLLRPGPPSRYSELSTNLGYLLGGSLFAQILGYAPFIGALVLATKSQRAELADFIVGLFLSRIPIVLFQAVQAALLPGLTGMVSAGRDDDFRKAVRRLFFIVCTIAVLGVIGGFLLGPFVGKILFGSKFQLGHTDVALLTAGSGLFILALMMSQALISLSGHAYAMWAWFCGIVAFVLVTAISSHDLFLRVEIGAIAGAGVAAVATALLYRWRAHKGIAAGSLSTLIEQIEFEAPAV
jgi:O-antigen/teichoic acid export membrane protein